MSNTYSQIYIHLVFAVKLREFLLKPSFSDLLEKYITGIVKNKGSKLLAIKAMADHMHLFISIKPDTSISELVRDIKACSSVYIKNKFNYSLFSWQTGYGAFSYSKSQSKEVIRYILNQEEHHKNHSFKEEYMKILVDFGVDYDEKYLFTWISEEESTSSSRER
ncbi:MAG TPA: IS200/IS605 family transposase [Ignavibacteriales bacterium]|nr:IS200/IS605 family transposase [Ignavibacteriales bacterium]